MPSEFARVLVEIVPPERSMETAAPVAREKADGLMESVDPVPVLHVWPPAVRLSGALMVLVPLATALASMPPRPRVRLEPEIV